MSTYSTKKGMQGENVLVINGKDSICPFTQPIIAQSSMGTMQIVRMPCTDLCPLCDAGKGSGMWYINCATHELSLPLDKPISDEPKAEGTLLKLS